ncbi:hypothetical protein [Actinokineospora fastidiosa]|uniref:Uncharacterized protein n=1 Tax=Actinokineospora fastidiosa TaxID=1816 RepID=A0A918GQC6_9PSEU|nr:hypothetical protein [Actinokineospora fastidiosa]GGS54357.1 hypothetical protein GCM10010171_56850 [Actinokineospora fastidiosa]
MSQVIALLLVALGIEVGHFRSAVTDPNPRLIAILAVSVLCFGEIMGLPALPRKAEEIFGWHMYVAFIATVEACLVAFATLIWVLVIRRQTETTAAPDPPRPIVRQVSRIAPAPASVLRSTVVGFGLGIASAALVWVGLRRKG